MKLRKYTLDALKRAIKSNFSLRNVLVDLGVVPAGGNYQTLKKAIRFYGIDTSHFTGQGYLKNKSHNYGTRPLAMILVKGGFTNTFKLKNRLLKEGVKSEICECCGLTEWQQKPIPLELHHIDGNRENNLIENLTLLCPNCHALTPNYRGKNKIPTGPMV